VAALVAATLVLGLPAGNVTNLDAASGLCHNPDTALLVERGPSAAIVDMATFAAHELPIPPEVIAAARSARDAFSRLAPRQWNVTRTTEVRGRRIVVEKVPGGEIVFDVLFPHRIELATSAVSPSGRFSLFIQANNIASEITILDAQSGTTQLVKIPHDAPLAAYAIGVAFSPDQRCVAISMERVGADAAETWTINLETGALTLLPVPDAFVLDWIRTR
jgi:hypothetical protein